MKQIDLDDLPPRIAQALSELADGEELVLVRAGAVVGRLKVSEASPPKSAEALADLTPEDQVQEVLEQFSAMINDEF